MTIKILLFFDHFLYFFFSFYIDIAKYNQINKRIKKNGEIVIYVEVRETSRIHFFFTSVWEFPIAYSRRPWQNLFENHWDLCSLQYWAFPLINYSHRTALHIEQSRWNVFFSVPLNWSGSHLSLLLRAFNSTVQNLSYCKFGPWKSFVSLFHSSSFF